MKMLTVSLLVCALMALSRAAAVPDAEPTEEPSLRAGNSPSVDGSSVCPTGWTGHNDLCFQYDPTPMTWADAEKSCQGLGGNLASVHSFYEHQVIQSMILRATRMYPLTWLGGYDATQEGTWFWSDGTPFTYNYWDVGQPDNRANADCLLMNFGEQKKFDDQPCSYLKPFVCAKKRSYLFGQQRNVQHPSQPLEQNGSV